MRGADSRVRRFLTLAFCTLFPISAWAVDLRVEEAWIRMLPGGTPAGGYFVLHNDARQPAVLVSTTSPAFGQVMMHKTTEEGGVSRMLHVDSVDVPTGGKVVFAPGGYHLMLMQPTRKLAPGERIPITLEFLDGRRVAAEFKIRGPAGK